MARTKRKGPPPQTIHVNITLDDKQLLESMKKYPDEPLYETFHRVINNEEFEEQIKLCHDGNNRLQRQVTSMFDDIRQILEGTYIQNVRLSPKFIETLSKHVMMEVRSFYKSKEKLQ